MEQLSHWNLPDQKAGLPSPSALSCGDLCPLKKRLRRKRFTCFSKPQPGVPAGTGGKDLCTHRVAQGGALGLASVAVVGLSIAWCKEVSADTAEGVKERQI